MPSEDFDQSADPLTAPVWPLADEAVTGTFAPTVDEVAQPDSALAAIPKPPDVGEILRGEYSGWVPIIKAGESLVDAQERADRKIRRIEAEIEASDIEGASSVSMWIPYNTGAVPLPPKVTAVPPTDKAAATVVIPQRPSEPEPPVGEFTRMIPDPDQVLSPADALEEARRRIKQMRQDLESNVAMVTRSFEHEFFAVPGDSDTDAMNIDALDDDAQVSDEVAELIASYTPPAPPPPAPRTPRRTLDEIADEIEAAIDANDARIGEHVVNAGVIREKLRREREAQARTAAARAAAERGPVLPDDVMAALNLDVVPESVNGEPVLGTGAEYDPSLEPLNADMPARATLDDVFTVPAVEVDYSLAPESLASDVDEELLDAEDDQTALPPDVHITDAVIIEPSRAVGGDSEAKFLGDLLDSLADVEAAVTAVVNSTALDDVLAKYKDILEADTSGASVEDLQAAEQVSELAAATRVDISAMIEGLKAAAENFSDHEAGSGVAAAAATLEGIFAAPPLVASPAAAPLNEPEPRADVEEATVRAPEPENVAAADSAMATPTISVAEEVARMRAAALAALGIVEQSDEDTNASVTPMTAEVTTSEAVTDDAEYEADAVTAEDAEVLNETPESDVTAQDEPAQSAVAESAPELAAPVEPHLVSLVDSALRPVPLPPIFQGEPKRMSAQEQLDSLGGQVPTMVPPRRLPPRKAPADDTTPPLHQPAAATKTPTPPPAVTLQPPAAAAPPPQRTTVDEGTGDDGSQVEGGRRSNIAEEHEIDRIIAAASARSEQPAPEAPAGGLVGDSSANEMADDDEGDDLPTAAEVMGMAPRRERPAAEPTEPRSDAVSARIADETIFSRAAASPVAATYVLNEQASKDHSLELVIMRDEIRDLRDRLDASQRLIEDLMLRLAQLTEIALRGRLN